MKTVIFLGTPVFSVNVLGALLNAGYELKYVVTQPDKMVGRKKVLTASPVKEFALEHNLKVLQPSKLTGSEEEAKIIAANADLIITAAFGQFLSDDLLASSKIASINFHASLLPKYRGAAPIQYALLNGDEVTGITIMEMVKKMDAGDIFFQEQLNIAPDDNLGSLTVKLGELAGSMVESCLPKLVSGDFKRVKQDEAEVTFSPSIKPEQEEIDFTKDLRMIINQIRALAPNPGAYVMHDRKRFKIFAASPVVEQISGTPGTVFMKDKKRLGIVTSDQRGLMLETVQVQGGKKVNISDYLNGSGKDLKVGDRFVD
ncbi:methionyl-tRNA formyltransferase [Xylocopilactobacillus apicola]|uniref:Methionyl-tRNA formyltransferase n=1 Tax=Xylocopilactobacillus apicola TaxID=2932184 RepID=A0AAU9DIF1_9LACO|nr:methionyl-tRNA formyltransferase [Xylocopilactobacillus apicola]BDR58156.1 methionyl-tRNA formyltransferase [Xylocopilactobacillus apicola]